MDNAVQTGLIVAAIAIGCAMQPIQGHDPAGSRLSGRNPLSAISDVLRSREQRKLDIQCFVRARRVLAAHDPGTCAL